MLARLPDAPPGTRGISLFLVPKFLVGDDGTLGARNDARCHSIEHKLGIHGSPTCTMVYGDNGGATGWLVGEENHGLDCMFTMMNNARLAVGLQGVAIAERATQQALCLCERAQQGRAGGNGAIIEHPDVRRMLLTMRALTRAARAICYETAAAIDRAHRGKDDAARKAARPARLAADAGGEGLLDRYRHRGRLARRAGAWRHGLHRGDRRRAAYRDARIAPIYEGTNGIQAIDLVMRKLPLDGRRGGAGLHRGVAEHRDGGVRRPTTRPSGRPASASARRWTAWSARPNGCSPRSAPHPMRPSPAPRPICACLAMRRAAARSPMRRSPPPASPMAKPAGRIALARFFAENLAVGAGGLERTVTEGADSVSDRALRGAA